MNRIKQTLHELKHHTPFTIIATAIAILVVIFVKYLLNKNPSEVLFEILHPAHIFVSAIATSAMFYKYKKNFFQAILIGISGAILIGSISDVIFPYLGALIFNLEPEFHLPIIEEPLIILSVSLIGTFIGAKTKLTKIPHTSHVFLSVFASLFYLTAFSNLFTILNFTIGFLIVFVSVIIPCCLSDIVFPFLFLGEKIKTCKC
jgi:glucose-6-phosphate-specific signal transduction histidine kinase